MPSPVAPLEVSELTLPVAATVQLPGSKSHANRALPLAALTGRPVRLRRATPGDDVRAMVDGLRVLGHGIEWLDEAGGELLVTGERRPVRGGTIDCGLAGTTLRFLCAVAAVTPGEWVVTGNERMKQRPIGALVAALRQLGADVEDDGGCPPVRIRGRAELGHGQPARVLLDAGTSSQFVTALALIAPTLPGGLEIALQGGRLASEPYVELTAATLAQFGARLERSTGGLHVPAADLRRDEPLDIEADWSAAGPWLVLERLVGDRIELPGLDPGSTQGDRRMPELLDQLDADGPLCIDVHGVPDQTMNLAVRAAFRAAPTEFTGAANLRVKECDRLAVTVASLRAFGIDASETDDGLQVAGGGTPRHARPEVADDHRMAMAWAILGAAGAGALIDEPDCVAKSYPQFFADLAALRASPACIALLGMRAAGKSTLAAALGDALGLPVVDTDAVLARRHGPLAEFIDAQGWPAFRAAESAVLTEELRPGRIVALGGGALEDPANAELVRRRALAIELREEPATLVTRIAASDRPRLGVGSLDDEVRTALARRERAWLETADLRLPPGESVDQRVARVRAWLGSRPLPRRRRRLAEPGLAP